VFFSLSAVPIELHPILHKFSKVFKKPTSLSPMRSIDHQIPLISGAKPVNLRPYKYFYFQILELKKIVAESLNNFVIKPNTSPFSSPALLVRINSITIKINIQHP
jgi:hypothetical protein